MTNIAISGASTITQTSLASGVALVNGQRGTGDLLGDHAVVPDLHRERICVCVSGDGEEPVWPPITSTPDPGAGLRRGEK